MRACVFAVLALAGLSSCASVDTDRTTLALPVAIHTEVTFEPLDRNQAEAYLAAERHTYKQYTDPMIERRDGLARGREERYADIEREFPECGRQRHCLSHLSLGNVKRFERFNDLVKEINRYDKELIEIDVALRDWKARLELRSRAILNRFLVHEVLQLPRYEPRLQGVLVHSLESFETRRQTALNLMRFAGSDLEPRFLGDYDFRMLGRPVDEGAVIATFDVYLATPPGDFQQPTRYVVSFLVNTYQMDLRFYDKDFLRAWAGKFVEPYQNALREEAFCGVYSLAGDTLAPRFEATRPKRCAESRSLMRSLDAAKFADRFPPDRWLLPIAYYPMKWAQ
jgi:hypothetical protein